MTNTLVSENMKSVICKDWVMNKRWPPFHSGFPGLNMIIHIFLQFFLGYWGLRPWPSLISNSSYVWYSSTFNSMFHCIVRLNKTMFRSL